MSANDNVIPFDPRVPPDLSMTLRDIFAANAPEVPTWFIHEPVPIDVPPMPIVDDLDEVHRSTARDWLRDGCFDLPEEIQWFADKVHATRKARIALGRANEIARYVQWRWAYADMMLAERVK